MATTAATIRTAPALVRTSMRSSIRSAASGATRLARSAGSTALITVTSAPASHGTTSAAASRSGMASGTSAYRSPRAPTTAALIPRPASTPNAAVTRPTTPASTTTLRTSCPRCAPTHRSSAASRARCASTIVNVLATTIAATNSATSANPSNRLPITSMSPVNDEVRSSMYASAVSTSTSGYAAATLATRACASVPGAASSTVSAG
jgi:hypothetical protein